MNTLGHGPQATRPVIDRVHGRDDGEKDLGRANIARCLVAPDVLLTRLHRKPVTWSTGCIVRNANKPACHVAHDERVVNKLNEDWKMTMCSCFNTFPSGNMEDNFSNVKDLHNAGVDILAGTDVSVPLEHLGGLAHGVSVHHEMQLLVEAGLTPIEALKSATSVIAKRFSLSDRGRIAEGLRADLVLVKGDPSINISDTLSIVRVWKEGVSYL